MSLWSIRSRLQWFRNYKNQPRDARVIVENKVAPFFPDTVSIHFHAVTLNSVISTHVCTCQYTMFCCINFSVTLCMHLSLVFVYTPLYCIDMQNFVLHQLIGLLYLTWRTRRRTLTLTLTVTRVRQIRVRLRVRQVQIADQNYACTFSICADSNEYAVHNVVVIACPDVSF